MYQADDAVARLEAAHICTDLYDLAGDVASQLHRHGKGPATVDAAMVSGGLAVEFMNLTGAVFDIPARHRCGDHFHQNVVEPDVGFGVIAVNELVRHTKFK